MIYEGFWFSPLRSMCSTLSIRPPPGPSPAMSGCKLFKGSMQVIGRPSPYGLYNQKLSTYGTEDQFDHRTAEGFIELLGLPLALSSALHRSAHGNEANDRAHRRHRQPGGLAPEVLASRSSLADDRALVREDLLGAWPTSRCWGERGIVPKADAQALREALLDLVGEPSRRAGSRSARRGRRPHGDRDPPRPPGWVRSRAAPHRSARATIRSPSTCDCMRASRCG